MSDFSQKMIDWYELNKRDLPWRHTKNPYHIWISEIMLQQTQAATVIPYYDRFLKKLPTVYDLATVDDDVLNKLWEGLGYYSRARNLKISAIEVVTKHQGKMPNSYDELIKLKGIGKYTAGAILSIAYNLPFSATDGNVIRTISRHQGIFEDTRLETTKKQIDSINQSLVDLKNPNIYTQAMIEIGATVCTKSKPKCDICPINLTCFAYNNDKIDLLPFTSKLKEKKEMNFITLILKDENGDYLLDKQKSKLLNGLYLYPQFEAESINYVIDQFESEGLMLEITNEIGAYKHIFTHLKWYMSVFEATVVGKTPYISASEDDIDKLPMATAHKQIMR